MFTKPPGWKQSPDPDTPEGATQIVIDAATKRWPRNANELRKAVTTLEAERPPAAADPPVPDETPAKPAKKKPTKKKPTKKKPTKKKPTKKKAAPAADD